MPHDLHSSEADEGLALLIDKLCRTRSLSLGEYERLIAQRTPGTARELASRADAVRRQVYGTKVFTRGLIEVSSFCKKACLYCGIRRSNATARRYRLSADEIVKCANIGYDLGFRTFVLQGGEDPFFTDDVLCGIIGQIRAGHPDCAVTLSFGERSRKSYERLHEAGAERYLLRHETASPALYRRWHPPEMSLGNRMRCLSDLREIGYAVGAGFMVGAPFQTAADLACDLQFIEQFQPEMCGIGPFIPQKDTPFGDRPAGTAEQTVYLLSLLRLMQPKLLLPATTALGTILPDGRERGLAAGENVVMPNLSPLSVRKKYALYDGKLCTGEEAAQCIGCLSRRVQLVGANIVIDRGDVKS